MSKVYRVFVEKRKDYAVEAVELLHNIKHQLKITGLEDIKVVNRYDVGKHNQYETNYRWLHRFCCWALEFEFEKDHVDGDKEFKVYYYFYNL